MESGLEREIKIRIASPPLKKIEEELDRLAKTLGTEEQTDYYFDKENMELTKGDKALRLRMTDTRSELTYKGPRLSDKVKARAELSLMLEDPESMRKILLNLGYNIILIVKKEGRTMTIGAQ
jgi:adenylyl cyclase CyaB, putative